MPYSTNLFQFSWEQNKGLDLEIINWESRVQEKEFSPIILEMGMALYSAFRELRTIRRIMEEGKPGIEHSFYQVHFEIFSHNHFLSIALNRVLKILHIGYPEESQVIQNKYKDLIQQVNSYRNSLEHQTEIGKGKDAPSFFNNLSSKGYESNGNSLGYSDIEHLLNEVMAELERNT